MVIFQAVADGSLFNVPGPTFFHDDTPTCKDNLYGHLICKNRPFTFDREGGGLLLLHYGFSGTKFRLSLRCHAHVEV